MAVQGGFICWTAGWHWNKNETRVAVADLLVEKVTAPALIVRGANLYPLILFSKTLYKGFTGGRYEQDSCEYSRGSCFDLFLPRICPWPLKCHHQSVTAVALPLAPRLLPKQAPRYPQEQHLTAVMGISWGLGAWPVLQLPIYQGSYDYTVVTEVPHAPRAMIRDSWAWAIVKLAAPDWNTVLTEIMPPRNVMVVIDCWSSKCWCAYYEEISLVIRCR